MKKVLFVASECVPFIKTGGLADVVGSLPKYFDKSKYDVRVMIPKYTAIPEEYKNQMHYITHFYLELAWRKQYVGVFEMELNGVKFYFLDNEFYFSGSKPYGEIYQDIEKFAFFDKAALSTLPVIDFRPDIIHCHDWQTGLEVRSHLAKLGFRGETVFKPCEALSGGELARLRFAEIVLERPNLLFLDEPTNHLDIYTRENLTEALMAYTGTLLMVTHDRHLMNSLGCPILYLEDGKATLYPSYDALMGRAAPAAAPEKAGDQPAKTGYGKEQRRRRAELRAKIKACEDEMEACGAREVELDNEINSPEVYNDPDLLRQKSDELSDLRFHQEELFAAWEKAMEEQEQYEQAAGKKKPIDRISRIFNSKT